MALQVKRTVESKTIAKGGRAGVKRRDMNLPDHKKDQLCASLRQKGLWNWDDDWPNDEEDWFGVIIYSLFVFKVCCPCLPGFDLPYALAIPGQEIYYYPTMRKEFTKENSTGESVQLNAQKSGLDKDFLDSLTSESGAFASGALPALDLAGKDGEKAWQNP